MIKKKRTVASWTETVLLVLETATQATSLGLGPPPVARALAIIYTAAYTAWAAYTTDAESPVPNGPARRPASASPEAAEAAKAKAVSYAIHRAASNVFPARDLQKILDAKLVDALGYVLPPVDTDADTKVGLDAADAVIAVRLNDNSNQAGNYEDTTHYHPSNPPAFAYGATHRDDIPNPSNWQALTYFNPATERTKTPSFITPQWKDVPAFFALSSGSEFRPTRGPALVGEQRYVDQARHVLDVQRNLTLEQKVIAEYWADGPRSWLPPGHWCSFGLHVSERGDTVTDFTSYNIDRDTMMFFALANAVFNASIATWDAKYAFDSVRPITAIRWLFDGHIVEGWLGAGGGIGQIPGERWRPFQKDTFPTPPFPEYTSGHSAFSMAAAIVLKHFTGSNEFGGSFLHTGPLDAEPGLPKPPVLLTWKTFTTAALQAGESRIFGGIHFHEGNSEGLALGEKVGEALWEKAVKLFGTSFGPTNEPAAHPLVVGEKRTRKS